MEKDLLYKGFVEFFGTFSFLVLGIGGANVAVAIGGLFGVATAFGLGLFIAVLLFGELSGAHLNPAISTAFALFRRRDFPPVQWFVYVVAQLVGGFCAAFILWLTWTVHDGRTLDYACGFTKIAAGFLAETVGTMLLTLVVARTCAAKDGSVVRVAAGAGAVLTGIILVFGVVSGGCFNPARDFGPRFVNLMNGVPFGIALKQCWLYLIAPTLGAVIGLAIHDYAFVCEESMPRTSSRRRSVQMSKAQAGTEDQQDVLL
ncbi:MAG: hypothetical protein MHM6MM_001276 [Cercozoa sp. M6MM]